MAINGGIMDEQTRIIKELLDMIEDMATKDDACVGYKSRERVLNRARRLIGEPEEEIPDGWRE